MGFRMRRTAAAVASVLVHGAAGAQSTPPASGATLSGAVTVTAESLERATLVAPAEAGAVRDTGDLLRDIPGVSGVRMGGHAIDPVIRGLGQTRLNVLLDGAYIHGACPNRMDPPSAYGPAASYERIVVLKGVHTLEYGGGGPGGTVLFERVTPRFDETDRLRGRLEGGYRGNGDGWDAGADLAAGTPTAFARLVARQRESDNYRDGDGDEVRSAFQERSGALILGLTPSDQTRLEVSLERQQLRDVLFAGAGMDSPKSDGDTYRLKFQTAQPARAVDALRVELYGSQVDHVMDNYTLRTPASPMMLMRAPSSSDTAGGRLVAELESSLGRWKLGVDVQNNERGAIRVNDFNDTLNSVLWPGVSIDQAGAFAELTHALTPVDRIVGGLRYDHVGADASKADVVPDMPKLSPNALYALYYDGARAEKRSEDNWSGLLRWERDLTRDRGTVYLGLSRTVRTADATERFIASNAANPSDRWVGNPHIAPEKHHQLEAGVQLVGGAWNLQASAFYNGVEDFILRDRFHRPGNNATIYRNVRARLIGGEASALYRWSERWSSSAGVAYVWADNATDQRPIAQIPPLEAVASLDYAAGSWQAGARVRAAAEQTRVDDDPTTGSGLDVGRTPGWAVVDVYASYQIAKAVALDAGVDNLFDTEYAQHLNRSSAFDPQQVQVNEPGLSAWIRLRARF